LILAPIIVFEPDGCFGIHDVIDPEGLADLGNVETLLRLVVVIESGDGPVDITGKREKVEVILTAQIDPAGGNDVAGERRLVVQGIGDGDDSAVGVERLAEVPLTLELGGHG